MLQALLLSAIGKRVTYVELNIRARLLTEVIMTVAPLNVIELSISTVDATY